MSVELVEFEGNSNIGLYCVLTDEIAIVPEYLPKKFVDTIERILKVKVYSFPVDPSVIGALMVINNKGILLSSILSDEFVNFLKNSFPDHIVQRFEFDYLALGNLVVTTDEKTLISPLIKKEYISCIEDTFDTEVITAQINGSNLVGSLIVTNSLGAVISPLLENENSIQNLQETLKVNKIDISTVNKGSRFPSTGILCNKYGVLLGKFSTGLETIAITNTLFPS